MYSQSPTSTPSRFSDRIISREHGRRTVSIVIVSERTEIPLGVKGGEDPVPQIDDSVELRVNEGVCGGL